MSAALKPHGCHDELATHARVLDCRGAREGS